jgi:hypothetical protein
MNGPKMGFKLVEREIELPRAIVPAGQIANIAWHPPEDPFRPNFLVVDDPEQWVIQDVRVGAVSQIRSPAPAYVFNNMWTFGIPARWDVLQIAMLFHLVVANLDDEHEQTFVAKVIGQAFAKEPFYDSELLCQCGHKNGQHCGLDGIGACQVSVRPGELCSCDAFLPGGTP